MSDFTKQRIALFMPSLRGGGAERVMVTLAGEFVAKGHVVDLVVVKAEGPYVSEVSEAVNLINLNSSRTVFSLFGLIRYLIMAKPYVLLSTLPNTNLIAVIAKLLSRVNVRVILREANTLSANTGKHKRLSDQLIPLFMRFIYPFSDQVIGVSQGVADDLIQQLALPVTKVSVVYSPVVTPFIFEKANEKIEHPWFAQGQPPVIIGVGRLTHQKGFDVLIKAVIQVRETTPVRLMILGEGEDRAELESLIKAEHLENEISLPGFVENPFSYMKNAAVFVLSSRWEGLPNTLIQAMALGVPVVSTDCPSGPDEILESGKWGSIVEVDNVDGLVRALKETMANLNPENIRITKEYCEQKFSSMKVVTGYLDILLGKKEKG